MAMYSAELFAENLSDTTSHAKKFLEKYAPLFKFIDSEDILEIGCANGCITKEVLYPFVKKHLNHLIGTDISDSAIKIANEANNNPDITFDTLDITNSGECEKFLNKFQHIFAFYVFHTIGHLSSLWSKNINEMLKPNGQLFASILVSSPNFYNLCLNAQREEKTQPWHKYIINVPNLFFDFGPNPKEAISKILVSAGFSIDMMETRPEPVYFKEFSALKNTLTSVNPCVSHVPEELKEAYITDYINKALKYSTFENGLYGLCLDVLTVVATKK